MTVKNPIGATARWLAYLPPLRPLWLLDVGCGDCPGGEALLAALGEPNALRLVGVDLDEMATRSAQARLPGATFLCADAACLPAEYRGRFHVALIHRPDLFAQPERWRQVFAALPALLRPAGRIVAVLIGEAETAVARGWLERAGCSIIQPKAPPAPGDPHLLVADVQLDACQSAPTLSPIQWDDDSDAGLSCDTLTGNCSLPAKEVRTRD